jgi:hypothetical protein
LSQLFWVFLVFGLFYLALAYYLLPAISITLKVRRRKLLTMSDNQVSALAKSSDDVYKSFSSSIELLTKQNQVDTLTSTKQLLNNSTVVYSNMTQKSAIISFASSLHSNVIGLTL